MRLKRLELKAFGNFTDRILSFDCGEPDLHIIYGPNEAGKSSSLRALKALLYGFPERTSDNFLHTNDKLLVGGCLQGPDGRELVFYRRKKRKADLLAPDGKPLDYAALAVLLHEMEPALFESLYGIDHKTLVAGGEDILAQKGEVGQALFAAGTGISSLKKILDSFEAEAGELFKAGGSKPQINRAIKEYNNLKRIMKEASLPPGKWKERRKRLKEAEDEQQRLEKESRQKSAEVQRLERLHKAIPELAELENLQKQLRQLGEVVLLPPDFSEQRQEVERAIRDTVLQKKADEDRLETLRRQKKGISLNQSLLGLADTVENLHQRLGKYRKDLQDGSRLEGMRIAHRKDAAALIEEIRPDLTLKDAESLRSVLNKRRTIHDLSSRYQALGQQVAQSQMQKKEAEEEIGEIVGILSGFPEPRAGEGLAKAIKLARKAGEIDGQIEEIHGEIEAGKKKCREGLKRLGLWSGSLEQLPELPLPLMETIRRFDREYGDLALARNQLKKDRNAAEKELKVARAESREIVYGGNIPSEQELENCRKHRENGWRLLRRKWIHGENISQEAEAYAPGQSLPDAYEAHVKRADIVADRLRREAERVARAASLRARIENLEETMQEIIRQENDIANQEQALIGKWHAEWNPSRIKPLSPAEMISWVTDIEQLRSSVREAGNKERGASGRLETRNKYRAALLAELRNLGESGEFAGEELTPVLVFAESTLTDIQKQREERERLIEKKSLAENMLKKAGKKQTEAEADKIRWQENWDKALAGLGLQDKILPSEALDLLETVGRCFDKLDKANEFQSRIDGINRDINMFYVDVQKVLEQAAPELKKFSPEQSVPELHTLLNKTRMDNELLQEINREIDTVSEKIRTFVNTLAGLDVRMKELLATARCDKTSDLDEVVRKSSEYQRIHEKISGAESTLARVSEGVPIDVIKRQAEEVNVDELPARIASLKRDIEERLIPGIKEALTLVVEERRELQSMDGSGRAAEAAEKMEQVAARIHRLVDQYTRIKLAGMVLRNEIERYREEHQDPILRIASRIFSELTLGSFSGLQTDIDDYDNPVLVGLRPDDARVPVEGMSDGTCDQLYLALRLATLEWRLENSEPMPFIVDDILINFDDDRSKATLSALAALAEKNQVILFTHHRRIVDEAQKLGPEKPVHVHEL